MWKIPSGFVVIFLLVTTFGFQLILFYSSSFIWIRNSTNSNKNPFDYRSLSRRIKFDPTRTIVQPNSKANFTANSRVVNKYTFMEPLITVEMRSLANPFPPFEPLILMSPFIRFVTDETTPVVKNNLHQFRDKVVGAKFSNGTVVTVSLVNVLKEFEEQKQKHPAFASALNLTVHGTWNVLNDMGIDPSAPPPKPNVHDDDDHVSEDKEKVTTVDPQINWTEQLPPWGQILENYGAEPVILGLDRCQAYRDAVPPEQRIVGPAGMFSTGTNLFFTLMLFNCLPPPIEDLNSTVDDIEAAGGRKHKYLPVTIPMRKRFVQWQAPWGKRTF
jgi:hypothetical protein